MASLGSVRVFCPICGQALHVEVVIDTIEVRDGYLDLVMRPQRPTHTCGW